VPDLLASVLDLLARFQLSVQERGEHLRREVTRSHVDPGVLVDLPSEEPAAIRAFFAKNFSALDQGTIVDQQRTTLATREVLRFVKALRRETSEGPEQPAPVLAEQAVRVVLDNGHAMTRRHLQDSVHLTRHAGVMY